MADYQIRQTGAEFQALLDSIYGLGLRLGGVLTPGATIATPLVDTFWFAPAGTYTYGESQTYTVNTGYLGIIQYMTGSEAWSTQQVLIGTDAAALAACQAAVAELSENLQDVEEEVNGIKESLVDWQYIATTSLTYTNKVYKEYFPFEENSVYKVKVTRVAGTGNIGIYAYQDAAIGSNVNVTIATLNSGVNEKEVEYTANTYQYIGIWAATRNTTARVEIWLYNGTKIELLDEVAEGMRGVSTISLTLECLANNFAKIYLPLVSGRQYTINAKKIMATALVGIYAYQLGTTAGSKTTIGVITTSETEKKITYLGSTYPYIGIWSSAAAKIQLEISWYVEDNMTDLLSQDIGEINARTSNSFVNPIILSDYPDPCIWNGEDGYWYMFSTGTVATKKMYRSANLVNWEYTSETPFTEDAINAFSSIGETVLWAPEVVKIGNKWNMYLSGEQAPLVVFQSNYPTFGYEFIGEVLDASNKLSGEDIDPCVRRDRDGKLWLFWDSAWQGMYRIRLKDDGLSIYDGATKEHVAGISANIDTTREKTFEGAYLYRRKGYWYLFVSAGKYNNATYCIRVGRSASLGGTFVDKEGNPMTEGNATLILSANNTFYGTGHNASIITDKLNKTWMLFHSHWHGTSSGARPVCISEVLWDDDGWPYFKDGTLTTYGDGPAM